MNAYSEDLRLKALAALDRGMPRKEAVGTFGVSLATLKRWLKRRREGGGLTPKPSPGTTPRILATSPIGGGMVPYDFATPVVRRDEFQQPARLDFRPYAVASTASGQA